MTIIIILKSILILCIIALAMWIPPFIVYHCVKFGTIAFYKAKEYIEKEKEKP